MKNLVDNPRYLLFPSHILRSVVLVGLFDFLLRDRNPCVFEEQADEAMDLYAEE
jgi:hypothetical protein